MMQGYKLRMLRSCALDLLTQGFKVNFLYRNAASILLQVNRSIEYTSH